MLREHQSGFSGKVEIKIDGEQLPMSNFVQKFTASVLEGILFSLKGVSENYSQVTITIQRSTEKQGTR